MFGAESLRRDFHKLKTKQVLEAADFMQNIYLKTLSKGTI